MALEQPAKVVPFYQLLKNQGEELSAVLIKARLLMVQLYYQKEQDMVMQLDVMHASLKAENQRKRRKIKILCEKS